MGILKRGSRLPGIIKGLFFLLRGDIFIFRKASYFFSHIADLSIWIKKHKNSGWNDFYSPKFNYNKREELHEYVIETQKIDSEPIDYLEFGVSTGSSFRWWINRLQNKESKFYGFDTFSGLPEDWGPFKKGEMNNNNIPPEIEDNRHAFYQGLFQQTLIPFLKNYNSRSRKVIHLDADLYSATLYVLTTIHPYLKSGDILFFDEFNVPMHEFKAFKDWSEAFYVEYEVLGSVNNFYQTAIMIL